MYNLLIIDDEPLILESLYQMILKKEGEAVPVQGHERGGSTQNF